MRALLHYIPLVGIPVLGVSLVLRAGESTVAPPGVGGAWTFVPSSAVAGSACAPAREMGPVAELSVAQSGTHVTISLNQSWRGLPAKLHRLSGNSAELVIDAERLQFTGVIDRGARPERMQVQIRWPECPGDTTLSGIATRRAR